MSTLTDEEAQSYGCLMFVIGALVAVVTTVFVCRAAWQESAVRNGVGRYNTTTATFEWIQPGENRND